MEANPSRLDEVRRLFLAARRISHGERAAFLQAEVDRLGDPSIRDEVETLLSADQTQETYASSADGEMSGGLVPGESIAYPAPRIDGYQIQSLLGAGGMGSVWKAVEAGTKRPVALKVMSAGRNSERSRARFEREIELASRLEHPHIARIYRSGIHDGRHFYAMEYVDGLPLDQYVTEKKPARGDLVRLMSAVSRAIGLAHQRGVIHRDIKPTNILIDRAGQPHILDFGLAKSTDRNDGLTHDGEVAGTLAYMAPEQAAGKIDQVDTRSDVWSLCVIMYQLLVGKPPLDLSGSYAEAIVRVSRDEVRVPRSVVKGFDPELEAVLLKGLSRKPDARYASAAALADDLDRYLRGDLLQARSITFSYFVRRRVRKHAVPIAIAGAVVLVLSAFAVVAYVDVLRARDHALVMQERAETGEARAKTALTAARESEREAAAAGRAAADAGRRATVALADNFYYSGVTADSVENNGLADLWFAHEITLMPDDPDRTRAALTRIGNWGRSAFQPVAAFQRPVAVIGGLQIHPGNGYLIVRPMPGDDRPAIYDLATQKQILMPAGFEVPTAVNWSADGRFVAVGTADGRVCTAKFPGFLSANQITIPGGQPVTGLSFSKRDRLLAVTSGPTVAVVGVSADRPGTDKMVAQATLDAPTWGVWFCGVDRFAAATTNSRVTVFDVKGDGIQQLKTYPHQYTPSHETFQSVPPILSSDGRTLLTAVDVNPRFRVDDLRTGQTISLGTQNVITAISLSPSGRTVAVANGSEVDLVELTPEIRGWQPLRHKYLTQTACFGATDEQLLTSGADRRIVDWRISPSEPAVRVQSLETPTTPCAVVFSPDGRMAATSVAGLVQVWDAPSPGPPGRLLQGVGNCSLARLSRQGNRLITTGMTYRGGNTSGVRVFETATGDPAGPDVSAFGGQILDADLSPDGTVAAAVSGRGGASNLLQSWMVKSGKPLFDAVTLPVECRGVSIAPDSQSIAVLMVDGTVMIFDPAGKTVRRWKTAAALDDPRYYVNNGQIRFGADGTRLFISGTTSNALEVWNPATGALFYPSLKHKDRCHGFDVSPDGKLVATAGWDDTAMVWDLQTGRLLYGPLSHADWVHTVQFSPDGTQLLTACRDGTARLWDYRAGTAGFALRHGHENSAAAFSADGRQIITVSEDGIARVWDTSTGRPLTPEMPVPGRAWSISVDPGNRWVALGGMTDGVVMLDLNRVLDSSPVPGGDPVLWGELISGEQLVTGNGLARLTGEQWYRRWQKFSASTGESSRR